MESKSCILSRRGSVVTVLLETQAHVCRLNKGWQLRSRELLFSKRGERCLFFLKLKPGCYLKVSLPPVPLFTLKEIPDVFVSSEETIHKCFFPVSHLKFKKNESKKTFGSRSHSLSFPPLSSEALSKSREIFFCRECYHQVKAEHSAVSIEATTPCRILPTPVGFVGTCSLWRGNDFHVHVFTEEFRVSFGREINFLIPLGATWNSLKIFSTCSSPECWCNLLYLFACTHGLINP